MRFVPHHPITDAHASPDTGIQGRFNLLLSHAGWQDDPWVDRLPRLLDPMGVTSHTATSARQASKVIEAMPIHVAIIDLGLPFDEANTENTTANEAGIRLLDLLRRQPTTPPTVVIKRGKTSRDDQREIAAALRAGAFSVLDRPRESGDLELLLDVLKRILTRHYQGRWPT